MPDPIKRLVEGVARITRSGSEAPNPKTTSILAQAASAYSARPAIDDVTMPTGFDPAAVALFESIVEGAFLVANADGNFDDAERERFQGIVGDACQNLVHMKQIEALVADLREMLAEDGAEKRISMITRTIARPEHQREVLRVAALMALASGDTDAPERAVIEQLARGFQLDIAAVDEALARAAQST
jgi:tellurite resistance protein